LHDEGVLDTGLIQEVTEFVHHYVQEQSWRRSKIHQPVPPVSKPSEIKELKRKAEQIYQDGGGGPGKRFRPPSSHKSKVLFTPLPQKGQDYPTIEQIDIELRRRDIVTKKLKIHDLAAIVDNMVWDRILERMFEHPSSFLKHTYRVQRPRLIYEAKKHHYDIDDDENSKKHIYGEDEAGTGYTEAPCSRCPVFDLCDEGGPVSAQNCEYFARWMDPGRFKDMEDFGDRYMKKFEKKENPPVAKDPQPPYKKMRR
jgi:DNA-directed RNA polymerase III subunit RPC6